jgi:hypothetical protein
MDLDFCLTEVEYTMVSGVSVPGIGQERTETTWAASCTQEMYDTFGGGALLRLVSMAALFGR